MVTRNLWRTLHIFRDWCTSVLRDASGKVFQGHGPYYSHSPLDNLLRGRGHTHEYKRKTRPQTLLSMMVFKRIQRLWDFPSGEVSLSLVRPCVQRRDVELVRLRRHLCRPGKWFRDHCSDVKPVNGDDGKDHGVGADPPLGEEKKKKKDKPPITQCQNLIALRKKAKVVLKFIEDELGLKAEGKLPPRMPCGSLRSTVRSMYPGKLTPLQELGIKTSAKLERSDCKFCVESKRHAFLIKYKSERFLPTSVDEEHVRRFKKALSMNVQIGWNKRKYPYIPNGHATRGFRRVDGGNWNSEEVSRYCRVERVFSSGKPRIVTLYSAGNSEVLSGLHQSLYASMKGRDWLLVGSPTDEKVMDLNGKGEYVSVDYQSATDNIKRQYVEAAVQVLIDKAEGLTMEEEECLRVVAFLGFDPDPETGHEGVLEDDPGFVCWEALPYPPPLHTRGQPMGSLVSFPLLCLINKTVVDLSLADLLEAGKLTVSEFSEHRCLINGDDLLYREPLEGFAVFDGILRHGAGVGLVLNKEKTMRHPDLAEINSTLFVGGRKQEKTNCAALYMGRDVEDVVEFAASSCVSRAGFFRCVWRNRTLLACARVKLVHPIKQSFFSVLLRKELATYIHSVPISDSPKAVNLFPVCPLPGGYDLTREEEIETINREVVRLREGQLWLATIVKKRKRQLVAKVGDSQNPLEVKKTIDPGEVTLQVLSRRWEEKARIENRASDAPVSGYNFHPNEDLSLGLGLIDLIRGSRKRGAIPDCRTKNGREVMPLGPTGFISLAVD